MTMISSLYTPSTTLAAVRFTRCRTHTTSYWLMLLISIGLISLNAKLGDAQEIVRVLPEPIPVEQPRINIRRFARIPNYDGGPPKIVGITEWRKDLYVCSSVSGGYIHRVTPSGAVSLWFNVASALTNAGRRLEVAEKFHGGVRSIAFHQYAHINGLFYVSLVEERLKPPSAYKYLSFPSGRVARSDSVVYEFKVNPKTLAVDGSSLREVLRVGLRQIDHPIKQMAFKGRLLYIGHGDGSVHSEITGTGQNDMDALGKVLRINPRQGPNGEPYRIPRGNPFVGRAGILPEIFAKGFRNPHNLCFARNPPYDLFVADAGRDNVEEVNIVNPGQNYGWSFREGPFVHLRTGGLGNGIANLPADDARFGYTYPAAALGHYGRRGIGFDEAHQAIVGGCPIENSSPLNNLYLLSNFPSDGNIYFAYVNEMRAAKTTHAFGNLTMARLFKPPMYFDVDDSRTFSKRLTDFRDIVKSDRTSGTYDKRSDTRFGRGSQGEMYISSKQTGWIYLIENSLPIRAPVTSPSSIPQPRASISPSITSPVTSPVATNLASPTPMNLASPTPKNMTSPAPKNMTSPAPKNMTSPAPKNMSPPVGAPVGSPVALPMTSLVASP